MIDTLRTAMNESGLTLYKIAKDTGLHYAVVHRFATGERDLRLATAEQIADYLGLELRPKAATKARPRRAK